MTIRKIKLVKRILVAPATLISGLILAGCTPGSEPGTLANPRTNEQRAMYINKPVAAKPKQSAPAPSEPTRTESASQAQQTSTQSESEMARLKRENEELRKQNEQLRSQLQNK